MGGRVKTPSKNQPTPWEELKNQIFLGSETFVEEMQRQLGDDRRLGEVPRPQRRPMLRPLAWYFQHYGGRDQAIFEAYRSGGYSMREIGDPVGLHDATVSRIISLAEEQVDKAWGCRLLFLHHRSG